MREIEFRGKLKEKGRFDGFIVGSLMHDHETDEYFIVYAFRGGFGSDVWKKAKVIPKTVSQYTGLKDKNNVRIFEGDIVEYKGLHLAVMFSEEYGCFTVDGKVWMSAHKEFVAIGSIHDNPELLSGNNTGGVTE
jgi:uncharacterized phage protein (TIGR01671 family)